MDTTETNAWQINHNYIEAQLNNLVRSSQVFKFCIFDNYGNKTKYFNIDPNQFEQIEKILKQL